MAIEARFAHVNLIARDWKAAGRFSTPGLRVGAGFAGTPPLRRLAGRRDGLPAARIHGIHLRLPGTGRPARRWRSSQYHHAAERPRRRQTPGFGHIALAVADVTAARDAWLPPGEGPSAIWSRWTSRRPADYNFVYATDPKGCVELQQWSR